MKMSSDKPLPTGPLVEVPQSEQSVISTIPPTPREEIAESGILDSNDNPGVKKQYLDTPSKKPLPPRKIRRRPPEEGQTSSVRMDVTLNMAVRSRSQSQERSAIDERLSQCKKRPHSGVFEINSNTTWEKLAQENVTLKDERKQLTDLKVNLEKKSDVDNAKIESLQEELKATKDAKNVLEPQRNRAEKELTYLQNILQKAVQEAISRNAKLEEMNKALRLEATQARNINEKVMALQQSVINQLGELKETLHKKDKFIGQLKEERLVLMKTRDALQFEAAGAEHAQQHLASKDHIVGNLTDENLALRREIEAVTSELEMLKEQERKLTDEIWRMDGAPIVDRTVSDRSMQASWNEMVGNQTSPSQKHTPALTYGSSHDSPGIASPQAEILRKINDLILHGGGDLNDVFNSKSGDQEAINGSPRLRGLGIKVPTSADEFKNLAVGDASTRTLGAYTTAQTQPDTQVTNTSMTYAATQVQSQFQNEKTGQRSNYINKGVHTVPVTVVDNLGTILPPTVYVDTDVQPTSMEPKEPSSSSLETLKEKRASIFKPIYRIISSRPKDSYKKKTNGSGEATVAPEVVTNSGDLVVRGFAFEVDSGGVESGQGLELPALPSFPISKKEQYGNSTVRMQDDGVHTDPPQDRATSVPVENRRPQRLTFNSHIPSISSRLLSAGIAPNSSQTFTLPFRSKKEFDESEKALNPSVVDNEDGVGHEEPVMRGNVKKATPWWWYLALGLAVLVILTYALFEERRFWRDANELTRRAVISMRDERWESDWFEKIGYTLDQKFTIDRTGFC
jgi:hypothetical protein